MDDLSIRPKFGSTYVFASMPSSKFSVVSSFLCCLGHQTLSLLIFFIITILCSCVNARILHGVGMEIKAWLVFGSLYHVGTRKCNQVVSLDSRSLDVLNRLYSLLHLSDTGSFTGTQGSCLDYNSLPVIPGNLPISMLSPCWDYKQWSYALFSRGCL